MYGPRTARQKHGEQADVSDTVLAGRAPRPKKSKDGGIRLAGGPLHSYSEHTTRDGSSR